MKGLKTTLGMLCATLLLGLASCSKQEAVAPRQDTTPGQISNSEMTLTYGESLLNKNVSLKNMLIPFNKLSGNNKLSDGNLSRKFKSVNNHYAKLVLPSNAIQIKNENSPIALESGKTYYIAEGETFDGQINFWYPDATLYIFGTWSGKGAPVNNSDIIKVASTGEISAKAFKLNHAGAVLENYGVVEYTANAFVGKIDNYHSLNFNNNEFYIYSNAGLTNYCRLTFKGKAVFQASGLKNYGQVNFQNGLNLNSGTLSLYPGSVAEVNGGVIQYQNKIENPESDGYARLNIKGSTTFGNNVWTNGVITGKIDVNISEGINYSVLTSNQGPQKLTNGATLNQNIYIAGSGCVDQQGVAYCNDDALKFTLVAEVKSPVQEDHIVLSATDIKVNEGFAYVSYHTNDAFYGNTPYGALRVFNVQNPSAPKLVSEAAFNHKEFNGIDVHEGAVYAVGGNKKGAVLVAASLENGTLTHDLNAFKQYELPGSSAKNSFIFDNALWLVSGSENGGFFKLNPANGFTVSDHLYSEGARAKYVAENGAYQAFLAVEPGDAYLRISGMDGSNAHEYRYPELMQKVQNGKNVIAMDKEYAYIALSDAGVARIRLKDGKLMDHFVPKNYKEEDGSKVFKENGYTNGVALSNCYLFLANGADGVIVLNKNTFRPVGSFQLSESSNNVYAKDGLLFVATGRDGLNIIKMN